MKTKAPFTMNTINTPEGAEGRLSPTKPGKPSFMKVVQILSWVVTLIFIAALVMAIFQVGVNGNSLPLWAWLGGLALFAAAIGLVVMVIVYRGVDGRAGPLFDLRPSSRVTGELKSETQRVDANGASSLRAEIKMTQGVLQLTGGATDVMDAGFTYDDADWRRPSVEYAVDAAGQGNLVVKQKATHRPAMRQGRSEWVIRLNQELPTELKVRFGSGKAELKLGGLALARLQVESGVGELALDLRGEWNHSMEAFIKASIGDTVLRFPQHVGVRVQSSVSFGSVHPRGLTWDGEAYTNALYGQTPVTLEITVEGGVGKISLEQTG